MANIKDILTTILGVGQLVITIVVQAIDAANGGIVNWWLVGGSVVIAVIGYFQGKNSDGSSKTVKQVSTQIASK